MSRIIITTCMISVLPFGCGQATKPAALDWYQELTAMNSTPLSTELAAQAKQVSVAQYYQALLAATDDGAMVVGQRVLGGAHTALVAASPAFAALQIQYGTIGAMLVQGSPQAVDLKQDVAILAEAYAAKSGLFAATQLADGTHEKTPATLEQTSQALVNLSALEMLAGLMPTPARELGLIGFPGWCPQPPSGTATLFIYRGDSNNPFGHAAVSVKTSKPKGNYFYSYPMGKTTQRIDQLIFGEPVKTVEFPMDSDQVAQWQECQSEDSGVLQDAVTDDISGYHKLFHNCAQVATGVLKCAGQNLPLSQNTPFLTPWALGVAADWYANNNSKP